jgi:hypothetical protein
MLQVTATELSILALPESVEFYYRGSAAIAERFPLTKAESCLLYSSGSFDRPEEEVSEGLVDLLESLFFK